MAKKYKMDDSDREKAIKKIKAYNPKGKGNKKVNSAVMDAEIKAMERLLKGNKKK